MDPHLDGTVVTGRNFQGVWALGITGVVWTIVVHLLWPDEAEETPVFADALMRMLRVLPDDILTRLRACVNNISDIVKVR